MERINPGPAEYPVHAPGRDSGPRHRTAGPSRRQRDETAGQILERNRMLFTQKWERIAREAGTPELLRTLWPSYGQAVADKLEEQGRRDEAENLRNDIAATFPEEQVLR